MEMQKSMTKMKSEVPKKQMALHKLTAEYDQLKRVSKSAYNERVYMNLPVTRLERVFFGLLAERMSLDKTKLLRRIMLSFMNKYPHIVEEAKAIIDENSDSGDF